MFRGLSPRPGSFPKRPSVSVSVSQSGICADSDVCLNCCLIVSKSQYFCGLTEVADTGKSISVCVSVRVCFMKVHECSLICVSVVETEVRVGYVRD